jgi:hypothetical protein
MLRTVVVWSLLLASGIFAGGCGGRADLSSPLIDASSIRRVQLGMTESEVVSILGQPFSVEGRTDEPRHRVMNFSCPAGGYWYPMLWVHLRDGRVNEVYAKRYEGWDDASVYSLTSERRWESPHFGETFPPSAASTR